jgi:hypothetical protein
MKKCILLVMLLLCTVGPTRAESPGVRHWEVEQDLVSTYKSMYNALEEKKFFVVFEPNIGRNLERFAERWGEDYNRNRLTGIRSLVFCHAWYANQVSNRDPELLSLCPLHITLYQQGASTHIVFTRPTHVGVGSAAMPLLEELEAAVSAAVQAGIDAVGD